MSFRLSCPSCNHAFALAALPGSGRATCPRCGDVFPVRTFTEEANDGHPAPTTSAGDRARRTARTRGELPRMLGVLVVAGLLILAAGLPPFLVFFKRSKEKAAETPPASAKPPSQLTGLGYLRADCNIVFAVQPGPLLAHAKRTQQQPGAVLAQTGLPEPARGVLDQLGVPLAQIDHLAGGIGLGEGEDALRLALVVVLKGPLADEDEFLRKLKARPVAGKNARHDVVVGRFPLLLARVSPTVWVFGLDERDFTAVETGGHGPGGKQFRGDERSGLRGLIGAVPAEAAVWVAADDDRDWTQKPIVKLVGQSAEAKKWLPAIKDGRGGSLAVNLGDQPRVWLRVRTADAPTAERVRAYFAARAAEVPSAKSGGEGTLAQFDSPFDAETGKLLQRFLADAGK